MATTDSNGIVFLEETDPISPFHTTINTLQTGTSNAFTALKNGTSGSAVVRIVADTAARDALLTSYAPTTAKPLFVWVTSTSTMEKSTGSGFTIVSDSPWTTYTPTISNITVGAGSSTHKWRKVGSDIEVMGQFILGSGFTMNTNTPTVSLPVNRDTFSNGPLGMVEFLDNGSGYYGGWCRASGNTITFHHFGGFGINNSTPFGWASGDRMQWLIRYPAA